MSFKKIAALVASIATLLFTIYRGFVLFSDFSWINVSVAICEISLLALACLEVVLMSTAKEKSIREQDDTILIESAKAMLLSSNGEVASEQNSKTKVMLSTTKTAVTNDYSASNVDVMVFAEEATLGQLRRCFLSVSLLDEVDHVYLIGRNISEEQNDMAQEFKYFVADSLQDIRATTDNVLICRGTDILYPDVIRVAKTYGSTESAFLELRSVYSDERALGVNGVVEIADKRQMVREALSSRGLSTWSTGPAIVTSSALEHANVATTSAQFFRGCEKNGIHGLMTDEIMSEEISHEQTISEVEWRALDFSYSSGVFKHSYKTSGSRLIGFGIKSWAMLISTSLVRRIATIALVLYCVMRPSLFSFIDSTYLIAGAITALVIIATSYIGGDKRGPSSRIREFYFDIEAAMYTMYKSFIKPEDRAKNSSIVKKLPSVSLLLILTNFVLVFRVYRQYNDQIDSSTGHFLTNFSLFAGYAMLVTLLIGLGMVIVRQTRSAIRREVSRGANVDAEPIAMIDLSPGGAGCVSVTSMEVGKEIDFESSLPSKNGNEKFRCRAVIRSSVKWNDSYRVGIEFLEIDRSQLDILEIYCSVVYPHTQAREVIDRQLEKGQKLGKLNGKVEKRFLSYAASFVALGAIIFLNLSTW